MQIAQNRTVLRNFLIVNIKSFRIGGVKVVINTERAREEWMSDDHFNKDLFGGLKAHEHFVQLRIHAFINGTKVPDYILFPTPRLKAGLLKQSVVQVVTIFIVKAP